MIVILKDNISILKMIFPHLGTKLEKLNQNLDSRLIKAVSSREGPDNLCLNKKPPIYLHQKDDPLQEGEKVIQQYNESEKYSCILFYGIGLGYHIDFFTGQYPDVPFSIYEPVPEVFFHWLSRIDLKKFPLPSLRDVFLESNPGEVDQYCEALVRRIKDSILIIDLPGYRQAFPQKHRHFFNRFQTHLQNRRDHLNTIMAFQKRWTVNSLINFKEVLQTSNIILEKKNAFQGLPALLLSAGPSLQDEIENIRYIKDNGLAYIFSGGTAINTLIKHGVHPHAACTYDPSEKNQFVFAELQRQGIEDIPLIFGSSVGSETLQKYPGPKYHMLTSPDTISPYYLQADSSQSIDIINDAPSISVIALQLLYHLGFNPIILVGQDLTNDKALKAEPENPQPSLEKGKPAADRELLVEDVYGNKITTTPGFKRVKAQLEMYLNYFKDCTVINSSSGGVAISGSTFMPLPELIKKTLSKQVYDTNWLSCRGKNWDRHHLLARQKSMNDEAGRLESLINKTRHMLDKINRLAEAADWEAIEPLYPVFNTVFARLRENHFFHNIIIPMNQVPSEFLLQTIEDLGSERNQLIKAKTMVQEFSAFLDSCENDIEMTNSLFLAMNETINHFLNLNLKARAAKIKFLLVECDGILTDGGIYFSAGGSARKFNHQDIQALESLRRRNLTIVILQDERYKNISLPWGFEFINYNESNKDHLVEEYLRDKSWEYEMTAYVGIEIHNAELYKKAGLSITTPDAPEQLKQMAHHVTRCRGGEGTIREIAELFAEN